MADQNTSLPVRTEADPDERIQSKIVDFTTPTQGMEVTDGNAHAEIHANNPSGTDVVVRASELGNLNSDGDYDVTNNTKPSSSALIAHDRSGSIDDTSQNLRTTGVAGDNNKVTLDVSISDSSGNNFSPTNPLHTIVEENVGDEIVDYNTSAAVAKLASSNHDYPVSALKTLFVKEILATASGKMKIEVQLETAAASGIYSTISVGFNSTANPNIRLPFSSILSQITGANVRIIRTNLDNQAQDLYSTIIGIEK